MRGEQLLRCPRCRRSDQVVVIEVHEEWGETDPGTVRIDKHGALIAPSDFWFSAGDPVRVLAACGACSHQWRPRAQTISSEHTTRPGDVRGTDHTKETGDE